MYVYSRGLRHSADPHFFLKLLGQDWFMWSGSSVHVADRWCMWAVCSRYQVLAGNNGNLFLGHSHLCA